MARIEVQPIVELPIRSEFHIVKQGAFFLPAPNSRVSLDLNQDLMSMRWDDSTGAYLLTNRIPQTIRHNLGTMFVSRGDEPDTMNVVFHSRHLILPIPYDLG